MIYLTTKEFSITKGCSERYIKRLAKDGKIEAEKQPDKYNGYKYMIPLTELTLCLTSCSRIPLINALNQRI